MSLPRKVELGRRQFLLAAGGAAATVLAGCMDGEDTTDQRTQNTPESGSTEDSTPQSEQNPGSGRELILRERVYREERYPVRLEAGDTVNIHANVERGGPAIVRLYAYDGNFSDHTEVRTSGEFTATVNESGDYYINVFLGGGGEVAVRAYKTSGSTTTDGEE